MEYKLPAWPSEVVYIDGQAMSKESYMKMKAVQTATIAKMFGVPQEIISPRKVESTMEHQLAKQIADTFEKLDAKLDEMDKRVHSFLEIKAPNGKITKLKKTILPACFEQVLDLARSRMNIFMVGPAGCGKTTIGELCAKALSLEFSAFSCTTAMDETHILGRSVPDLSKGINRFEGTEFLDRYENGGVHQFDELDKSDPNVLAIIHTAIANRYCFVPNRRKNPRAEQHEDSIIIGSANTFGRGGNRMYCGSNQLDEAFLDRFRVGLVEVDYDHILEEYLCPHEGLRNTCWEVRERIASHGLRRIMSTRFMKDAYKMHKGCGWSISKIMEIFFQGWSAEERAKAWVPPDENGKFEDEKVKAEDMESKEEEPEYQEIQTPDSEIDDLPPLNESEKSWLADGNKITAIKNYRERTNVSLAQAMKKANRHLGAKILKQDDDMNYKNIKPSLIPKCENGHGSMQRMQTGNGWRCSVTGNVFKAGKWSICNHVVWDK